MSDLTQEKIVLGIYLEEPSPNIKDSLDDLGAIDYKQGYIFPFRDEELSTYEDLGQGVGHVSLGGVNESTADFYPSTHLTEMFASSQEVEPLDLDPSFIPDIEDFIDEYSSEIHSILQSMADKNGIDLSKGEGEVETDNDLYPENDGEKTSNEQKDIVKNTQVVKEVHNYATSSIPRGQIDPLLTLAADIFENSVEATLPVFDEYTSNQLKSYIVKSEATVHNARDKTIFKIYDIIKRHKDDITEEFERNYSKYTQDHNNTIEKIKKNEQEEVARLKAEAENEYKIAQDKFVSAQEQAVRDVYDSKHKKEHLLSLQLSIDNIENNAQKDIDTENKSYQEAFNREQIKYLERRFRQLDYTEAINNFNQIVAEENQILLDGSKEFKDQVGALTAKLASERDQFKKEAETEKRAREVLESTMSTQIDTEARRQAEQLSISVKKERDEAVNNANEQNAMNQKTITSLTESLNSEREKNGILTQQLQEMSEVNNKKMVETTVISDVNKSKGKRSGVVGIIMSTLLVMIAGAGLAFGSYVFINSNSNKGEQAVQKSVSSTTSIKNYSSGDKWSYKASDGKTYEVTMDSPTTGTYKDDNGNIHKIELN